MFGRVSEFRFNMVLFSAISSDNHCCFTVRLSSITQIGLDSPSNDLSEIQYDVVNFSSVTHCGGLFDLFLSYWIGFFFLLSISTVRMPAVQWTIRWQMFYVKHSGNGFTVTQRAHFTHTDCTLCLGDHNSLVFFIFWTKNVMVLYFVYALNHPLKFLLLQKGF